MKLVAVLLAFFIQINCPAQNYTPDWNSLDTRPVPQWFQDAKFGIFIHWGVYSVPGWCTKGNYAEWYQYGLQTGDSSRIAYHRKKFGDRSYYDLAKDFKAELFNADEWASLFERSGAKYIVLTSKHHDGFCLWPDKNPGNTWKMPWNAKLTGPGKDLLGELFTAVRKTSVHPGMYYSLYEWFNPLWKSDPKRFVEEHTWPQMKDLINTYHPDVFWTDGDWEATPETWNSQEFISWLYNNSPVKDRIVINDRWGSGVRFHHAGIYTPEYQPGLEFKDHYWEESRGMGFSYGYNREEDAWDYNSAQSLVLQLVDKVSRGGNFLLDIGPDEHGKIPPIMQERLLQMGEWMKINGEAIYNTTKWKYPSQWSAGKLDYKPANGSGDLLLKLTVDPDPGYAVKEVFFTYNEKKNDLYAILPRYPSDKKIILKNFQLLESAKLQLLCTGDKLNWNREGNDVVIHLPEYDPNKIHSPFAYVIRISGYGAFAKKPSVEVSYAKNDYKPVVTINKQTGDTVYYTLDGTEPNLRSSSYISPFTIQSSCTIKAIAIADGLLSSAVEELPLMKYEWMPAQDPVKVNPGLSYNYFEPAGKISMESLKTASIVARGLTSRISAEFKKRTDRFALQFEGFINVPYDGIYTFYTSSDDGSLLSIDFQTVVNNDGDHGEEERSGKALLRKGYHRILIDYFDSGGGNSLRVTWQPEGGNKEELPPSILFHKQP